VSGAEVPAMSDCAFCQIVASTAPATVLADGVMTLAIVPLNPVTEGHFLVLPKAHVTDAIDDPAITATVMRDASQWVRLFADRDDRYRSVNFITSVGRPATQSVFHLHIHVVPRRPDDGLALPWHSGKVTDDDEA
jgi:histidine triad (HIT) family protein